MGVYLVHHPLHNFSPEVGGGRLHGNGRLQGTLQYVEKFEGSRPEWFISSMIYSVDAPFWLETLEIVPLFPYIVINELTEHVTYLAFHLLRQSGLAL